MKTLTPDIAGPVTVTQLAQHAPALLRVVRDARQLLPVSLDGEVVALIRPATWAEIATRADLDDPKVLVPTRTVERDGPSQLIRDVRQGKLRVLTFHNKPFALVTPASQWSELDELFADVPIASTRSSHTAQPHREPPPSLATSG